MHKAVFQVHHTLTVRILPLDPVHNPVYQFHLVRIVIRIRDDKIENQIDLLFAVHHAEIMDGGIRSIRSISSCAASISDSFETSAWMVAIE